MKMSPRSAISAINKANILLVYPIQNRPEPASLWTHFFPKTPMVWEWSDESDSAIADLWHLREELSRSKQVVYAKWFRGRATFFSRAFFPNLLRALNPESFGSADLMSEAKNLFQILQENSPLSTKALKREANLQGRDLEPTYHKALKQLWTKLLIVGFGEVQDGAFPSLAMGATSLLFEELWEEARQKDFSEALQKVRETLSSGSAFGKFFGRLSIH